MLHRIYGNQVDGQDPAAHIVGCGEPDRLPVQPGRRPAVHRLVPASIQGLVALVVGLDEENLRMHAFPTRQKASTDGNEQSTDQNTYTAHH